MVVASNPEQHKDLQPPHHFDTLLLVGLVVRYGHLKIEPRGEIFEKLKQGKIRLVLFDGSCKRSNTDEVLGKQWDRYDAMIELPKCACNASEETFPDVRSAYATISSEESHRVAVGSIVGSSQRNQASAFVSNVPNSQNFQRSNQNFSTGPSRPNNMNNNRQGRGSSLNNNRQGGVLKKSGQNFKKQSVSNNNYVGKSLSSGFTDEQMATLISLIIDNKVGKNMQANMAVMEKIVDSGANHHMTYTDKN
ncbi:hypothetical protein Tco_0565633 [Tanacetum coccineum]